MMLESARRYSDSSSEEISSSPGTPHNLSRPGTPPPGETTLVLKQGLLDKIKQLWESVRITVFVLGTALILFAAARNTITWQLQRFWGASADYWQLMWNTIYGWFGGNEEALGIWGTMLVTVAVFWLANAFFLFLDTTGKPAFLLKYKIQEEKNVPIDRKKLKKAILTVLFNQFVVSPPIMYIFYNMMVIRGCKFGLEIPTFHWALFELTVYVLIEELMFYYSHRLLHHPRLYKYIHKQHHEWTAPIGIIGIYAHPLEHIVSNVLPPLMGPLVMGSHIGTAWIWFALALTSTTISHCGYHFPFLPSPEAHDFHHLKFNNCFGVMGVLDYLHGTDKLFRASKQYQRHFMTLSVTPIKEAIPDDSPKNRPRTKSE